MNIGERIRDNYGRLGRPSVGQRDTKSRISPRSFIIFDYAFQMPYTTRNYLEPKLDRFEEGRLLTSWRFTSAGSGQTLPYTNHIRYHIRTIYVTIYERYMLPYIHTSANSSKSAIMLSITISDSFLIGRSSYEIKDADNEGRRRIAARTRRVQFGTGAYSGSHFPVASTVRN